MNSSKKLFFNLSIGASMLGVPAIAEENSGWYATGSIGSSVISNIDYINVNGRRTGQMVTFDPGLGLDLGFGYDFGSARVEGTWSRGQSPGGTDRGTVFETDKVLFADATNWVMRSEAKYFFLGLLVLKVLMYCAYMKSVLI